MTKEEPVFQKLWKQAQINQMKIERKIKNNMKIIVLKIGQRNSDLDGVWNVCDSVSIKADDCKCKQTVYCNNSIMKIK